MRRALDAATLPPLVAGLEVERASCDGGCNMRQPPAPSDSRRSVAPPPGMGEGAPTARPSLPAAAPLLSLVSVSVSARPESRAEALMESRAEALSERVKESRRTRGDMGARDWCSAKVSEKHQIVSYTLSHGGAGAGEKNL